MILKEVFEVFLSPIVTIIGFVVTYFSIEKKYGQSILRLKTEKQISSLFNLQDDILELVYQIELGVVGKSNKNLGDLNDKIYSNILSLGSKDAIKIETYATYMIDTAIDDGMDLPIAHLIAIYVMLAMQIKYDTTGIETSPKAWYVHYTTQKMLQAGDFYDESVRFINKTVEELKLKEFLLIMD